MVNDSNLAVGNLVTMMHLAAVVNLASYSALMNHCWCVVNCPLMKLLGRMVMDLRRGMLHAAVVVSPTRKVVGRRSSAEAASAMLAATHMAPASHMATSMVAPAAVPMISPDWCWSG